jgi:pimeloyl-ACP methyl ester carboxylesterase
VNGIATNGAVRIAYDVRGGGPPLLLVQGLAYARWGWEPVVDLLAERFTVLQFDNRGVGESDVPEGPYTVADMAADAVAVLDAEGVERAHVVGASLGGMIAQELAVSRPGRVDRLVLACTTPGGSRGFPMPEVTVRLLTESLWMPREEALRLFVENALAPESVRTRPEIADRIVAHRLASPQSIEAWQAQAAAGATFDAASRIGGIRAPTLVLQGDEDVVVDPRNAELLAELIPDARVERFPGTGHVFFWEQPERFVRSVTEFLEAPV